MIKHFIYLSVIHKFMWRYKLRKYRIKTQRHINSYY